MSNQHDEHQAYENTDRELWREREGDYYADSIHVTKGGGIGINCGGTVFVRPIRTWHALAAASVPKPPASPAEHGGRPMTLREIGEAEYSADQGVSAPNQPGMGQSCQFTDAACYKVPKCPPGTCRHYEETRRATQPGDAVALLRDIQDYLLVKQARPEYWPTLQNILNRIAAHLSSAQSVGAQEMVWVIVRTDVNEPCSAHTDQHSAEIRQAVFSFHTKIVGIPFYAAASAKASINVPPDLMEALRHYQQADADGVMVNVSREALDKAIELLAAAAADQRGGSE